MIINYGIKNKPILLSKTIASNGQEESMFDATLERTIISAHCYSGGISVTYKITAAQVAFIYNVLSVIVGPCETPNQQSRCFNFMIGTRDSTPDDTLVYTNCSLESILVKMGFMTLWFGNTSQETVASHNEYIRRWTEHVLSLSSDH